VNVPDWLKAATKAKIETTDNTVSTNDPLSAIMPLEANIAIPTTTNIEEVVESPIMNDISHDNDDKALNVPE
jgi:hypothetical protein